MWPTEFAQSYRAEGYWQGETFGELLARLAERHGDRTAVVSGTARISYAELDHRADRLAAGLLECGVRPRDRVVVQLPNIVEFFDAIFALTRLGAVPVLALPAYRATEIENLCEATAAVAYITTNVPDGFEGRMSARAVPPVLVIVVGDPGENRALSDLYTTVRALPRGPAPCDTALLLLSGGSTGTPKLIPRTHDDYLYGVRAGAQICGLDSDSVYLCVLPVAHNFPLASPGVLGTLHSGGKVVLADRPDPDLVFGLIQRERVTITALVPSLALIWLEVAAAMAIDVASLRILQVGGAKLSPDVARRLGPAFGCVLQQSYGMSEGLVCYTRLDDSDEVITTTQGKPMSPADEIRIVDNHDRDVPPGATGHLLARGPSTIRAYWNGGERNRMAFTRNGFYRTGDLARITADGDVVVEGRATDMINRAGEKIAPAEMERHVRAHPAVRDVAVVGVPDRYLGERICAFVATHPDTDPPTAADLNRFLRARGLAEFKVLDRVETLESLPTTAVGKIDRRRLVQASMQS
ncbi:(2,3-dihydroxybenzoyl)adenylate synthase [Nocardia sp. CC227C]|uniref:(2,3-dihydroxybenzoyl)adenylate synthase n=1 Tax=Nocardia sp. CC227C TaxID=3044562 RepID=UPI00278C13DB|nr:AMP-binding protein [Nocardia sp. CC227C]